MLVSNNKTDNEVSDINVKYMAVENEGGEKVDEAFGLLRSLYRIQVDATAAFPAASGINTKSQCTLQLHPCFSDCSSVDIMDRQPLPKEVMPARHIDKGGRQVEGG